MKEKISYELFSKKMTKSEIIDYFEDKSTNVSYMIQIFEKLS